MTTRAQADQAITAVEALSIELAAAMNAETQRADERALVKHAGIQRLLDAKKFTSVTSAERGIEFDEEYMAHRQRERDAVAHRILMEGKLAAAKLRARLAVEAWSQDPEDVLIENPGPIYEGRVWEGHVVVDVDDFPEGSRVLVRRAR